MKQAWLDLDIELKVIIGGVIFVLTLIAMAMACDIYKMHLNHRWSMERLDRVEVQLMYECTGEELPYEPRDT